MRTTCMRAVNTTCWLNLAFLSLVAALVSTPLRPPAYPLSVRSPYLSTWVQGSHEGILDQFPEFWNGQPLGWTGLLRLNDTVYSFFGPKTGEIECKLATQIDQAYTPYQSSFRFEAAGVILELVFSNPLTPHDYKRQSIPFSYLEVKISSFSTYDAVDLYFDVNGAWVSGEQKSSISWTVENHITQGLNSNIKSHVIRRTTQQLFSEIGDMAEWGGLYWSTNISDDMTYSSGHSTSHARGHFQRFGNLTSTRDDRFRAINDDEPVFAFAKSFKASNIHQRALFTIGLVQEQALQVNLTKTGYKVARPLYQRYFHNIGEMISWHFQDYRHESHSTFSDHILQDSRKIDDNYASITSISAVQAMGGTQLVIDDDSPAGEPHLWMKEISSDGNMQTSDVMYPAFPFFLYANPALAIAMLEPLLIHQESGLYPNKYAMHDMGASYPNATGHADGKDEYMPVEECGNNLIMMLAAHDAYLTADESSQNSAFAKDWLTRHYDIALQWSQYLIEFGLVTELQLSTDDFAGRLANQTNLAVKAIVGIKCMSVMAHLTGHEDESTKLDRLSDDYMKSWLNLAYEQGVPFAKLAYQWKGSWGSLYNLYGDILLDLRIFPRIVYEQQDSWYLKVLEPYGLPLDSRHLYTKSDWEMTIASFSSPALYTQLYRTVKTWINETETKKPLIDLYDTIDGRNAVNMFTNRPVVGGHFAHLALHKMQAGRAAILASRGQEAEVSGPSGLSTGQVVLSHEFPL